MNRDRNGIPILKDAAGKGKTRRAAKRRPFEFTDGTKKKAYRKYNGICQWCGNPIKAWNKGEYHHLIPISRGGGRHLSNCLLMHPKCHNNPEVHAFLHFWGLESGSK